jgi:hypothetical protein
MERAANNSASLAGDHHRPVTIWRSGRISKIHSRPRKPRPEIFSLAAQTHQANSAQVAVAQERRIFKKQTRRC